VTRTTIATSELRALLEAGKGVTVVDIRRVTDRDWTIPGAIEVDAYDAVNAGSLGALSAVALESNPVVTVCGVGRTAGRATELLRARGINALTLEGGMQAWSKAWNTAAMSVGDCDVVQVRRTGKGCLSYIVASEGDAVVIDPSVDPEVYADLVADRGWSLVAVTDTHVHADHLSRSRMLASRTGARLHGPGADRIRFGGAELIALPTAGHSPEITTYLLTGSAAFTGDTLFIDGVGRPDLHGGTAEAISNAAALYRSIQALLTLPPSTLVLAGHTSAPVPFDGMVLAATIEAVRLLPVLTVSESEFVAAVTRDLPSPPPNHARILDANQRGEWPDDADVVEAGPNRCAVA
jgi:glyoxylase-like metal-dependent hydrolase (beta-lactamase superfamily II)/rhodanese-related sulfurtransferase